MVKKKMQRGFTLIELMIALGIIGVVTAIAWPNYQQYLTRSKRADAQAYLMDLAQREQQFLLDARRYTEDLSELGVTTPASVAKNYEAPVIDVSGPPAAFLITLAPQSPGPLSADGSLTLDSSGEKLRVITSGGTTTEETW